MTEYLGINHEVIEEALLTDRMLIKSVLNMDLDAFHRYKINATEGLIKFGNEFQRLLGMALSYAPIKDAVRILHSWQRECGEHEMMYRIWWAKDQALKEDQPDK